MPSSFRLAATLVLVVSLSATAGCATYDDSRAHQACQDSPLVKDLPDQVAKRETRCQEGLQIWNRDGGSKNAAPLDFSGRNKDS